MKQYTAGDVAGIPELYNLTWRIGQGWRTWECTGTNRNRTKVRFARVEVMGGGLHQITCYVAPEKPVYTNDEIPVWEY